MGRELRARALSHTAPVPEWHRLRSQSPREVAYRLQPHTTNGRRHQAQQPWREEHVGRHVPGLVHHVGAEWRGAQNGCSRTGRARWAMPPPLQRCTAGYRACTAEAVASESLGLSVGGCIRARGYFGPHPVSKEYTGLDNGEMREEWRAQTQTRRGFFWPLPDRSGPAAPLAPPAPAPRAASAASASRS